VTGGKGGGCGGFYRLDAAGAALLADDLLLEGETLQSVWRYVIVQLLDDYSRDLSAPGGSSSLPAL